MPATVQKALEVETIRQRPGPEQVAWAVKVNVPGKHFPQLQPAEHKVDYEGTAVEYKERHSSGGMGGHSTAMCCMCVQSHSVALILCTVDLILVR